MKKLVALSLALVFCFALVACGDSDGGDIVGTWYHDGNSDEYMTFKSNGTVIIGDDETGREIKSEYEVDGDNITLKYQGQELVSRFKISGDTLTIIDPDGSTMELKRAD